MRFSLLFVESSNAAERLAFPAVWAERARLKRDGVRGFGILGQ